MSPLHFPRTAAPAQGGHAWNPTLFRLYSYSMVQEQLFVEIVFWPWKFFTEKRILMFGTRRNLKVLKACELWLVDGTFKTTPKYFYQLYRVHGSYQWTVLPLVYGFLPDKSKTTYPTFFGHLKTLKPGLAPKTILVDLEKAVTNALQTGFPLTELQGCNLHFCRCILRHISLKGLKRRYEEDADLTLGSPSVSTCWKSGEDIWGVDRRQLTST